MIAVALALVLASADPCGLPEAALPDAGAAAAYVEVAEAEEAAGARETAALAYREALRRDPTNPAALRGLAETCGPRVARRDAPSALLEAAQLVRGGEDRRAAPLLAEALLEPETADAARLLLSVIARRAGEDRRARELLERAAAGPDRRVGATAANMLRSTRRAGRVALAAYAGTSWDSNAMRAPEPNELDTGDAAATSAAGVVVRPLGDSGPFASGGAEYRRQRRLSALDLAGWWGGGGLRVAGARGAAVAEYRYSALHMGGTPHLAAHAGRVESRVVVRRRFALELSSGLEHTRYFQEYARSFSGATFGGEARVAWSGPAAWAALGYRGARFRADDEVPLSWIEHGPAIEAGLAPARALRVWVEASLLDRVNDEVDPLVAVRREETALEASLVADLAIAAGVSARAEVGGRMNDANVAGLTTRKLLASLGLVWEASWP
jgi:hypothetical protein